MQGAGKENYVAKDAICPLWFAPRGLTSQPLTRQLHRVYLAEEEICRRIVPLYRDRTAAQPQPVAAALFLRPLVGPITHLIPVHPNRYVRPIRNDCLREPLPIICHYSPCRLASIDGARSVILRF